MKSSLTKAAFCLAVAIASACSLVRDLDDLEPQAGGDAAAPVDGDARVDAPVGGDCPKGKDVDMILQQFADGTRFCIDRTEVTQGAYATFLAKKQFPVQDGCAKNTSYQPDEPGCDGGTFDPTGRGAFPVVCVDHCDAATYCAARGKRLCGGKSGKNIGEGGVNDAAMDEWLVACGADRAFATGADVAGCVHDAGSAAPVTQPGCATPEDVLHLSGNVSEWTAVCAQPGGEPKCLARGGGFRHTDLEKLRCSDPPSGNVRARTDRAPALGFRCCANLSPP
jgi:formylglycine-generating enzyme required for sulfatase activity